MSMSRKVREWAKESGWTAGKIVLEMESEKHEGWIWQSPDSEKSFISIGYWSEEETIPGGLILEYEKADREGQEKEKEEIEKKEHPIRIKIAGQAISSFGGFFRKSD